MAGAGVCCARLEEPKALMKMGLSAILIGHVNFLLGALVHGVVLRHIHVNKQARAMEYAISNVVALTAGLLGVIVGILAIVLSKNKKSKSLTWTLFAVSLLSALMATASCVGLTVSVVRAIVHDGRSLLTHCRFPDAIGYSSVTECPFDPTRIYSTTLILWVPLIATCFIQLVFSARCFAACVSFLGLPCCPIRKRPAHYTRAMNVRPVQETSHPDQAEPPRRHKESVKIYTESPRRYKEPSQIYTEPSRRIKEPAQIYTNSPRIKEPTQIYTEPPRRIKEPGKIYTDSPRIKDPTQIYTEPPRRHSEPPRRATVPRLQHQPPPPPSYRSRQHRSLPHSEQQPLRQPHRERSGKERSESRAGTQQRTPEHHQLLQRGTQERSSFWI